ncbi:MAG: 4Fe-4S dicluster domain-containing protein [Clostridium sp.]
MFIFETQLKKVKHNVLKSVAILAKEDRLTTEELGKIHEEIVDKDKPQYRCCVYKERVIVGQRAKLAAGYLPQGDTMDHLEDIKNTDQIIYVVEAACDKCPINKYTVTEACRGCVAHKCMEVCPTHAMVRVGGKAYINQELCKECGLCKKQCPYHAISEVLRPCKIVCPTGALTVAENRQALIKEEDCIQCGACMKACPFGAISDKSFIEPVARRLSKKENLYAIVAPAIAGQFGPKVSIGQIKSALINVGFKDMYEAACGADIVTINESNEFVHRMNDGNKYMTNSCCPAFLTYIDKKFHKEFKNVSSTVSPMIATGKYIKSLDPEAKVVFIGPCTAKKSEMRRADVKEIIDYVLTFEEISALLDAFDMDPEVCAEAISDDASIYGRGFASGGGLTAAIENYIKTQSINIEFKPLKVSGPTEIKKAMTMASIGRLQGNFLEGMMCEGGCVGGAGTVLPPLATKATFVKQNATSSHKSVIDNPKIDEFKNIDLERNLE